MTLVGIVLGVILIIGGFSCMATPMATFLSTGYYMAILLLVFGICGIIRVITKKGHALDLITGILAVIVGIFSLIRPGSVLIFDGMLLYFVAFWFIVRGVSNIVIAFGVRKEAKGWFWGVLAGILGIILGCLSFAYPLITALTTGILIGLFFIEAGIDMIMVGFAAKEIGDAGSSPLNDTE
ncbi:MAG: DUF308 domain-containing protein [Lachnospiraceae bacterium]|nr:DUF308 domain-containing protein [Lachnospiraceae bacterium]